MIERIQTIKNVGTFKDHKNGKCELKKLTSFFGANSEGKSTITNILKSYQKNAPQIILDRRTVGTNENIEIKITMPNKGKIEFNNNKWMEENSKISKEDIQIFDTQFVQDNVFTNDKIEHSNKENFTAFILGEKSSKLNKELEELDEKIKNNTESQKAIKKLITEKCNDLDFENLIKIKLITDEEANDTDTAIFELKTNITNAKNNSKNITEIKNLPLPIFLNIDNLLIENLIKYENIFASNYLFSAEEIMTNFEKHKKEAMKNNMESDIWLSKGIELKSGDSCPFCGNNIKDNSLVSSYLTIFCSNLKEYNRNIDWILKEKFKIDFSNVELLLNQNQTKIDKLKTGITHCEIITFSTVIDNFIVKIESAVKTIKDSYETNNISFEISQKNKLENRYNKVEYECITLKTNLKALNENLVEYNNAIERLNVFGKKYLEELSIETLKKEVKECEEVLKEKQYLFERHNWDKEIKQYLELNKNIKENNELRKLKKEEFDKENNDFLDKYFESVNKYFERLNSKNFTIIKEETTRGKKKVYSLILKYRDQVVESDKLNSVLSESDRRALALSIFLSFIKQNYNSNAVIIFDDPIVSFDIDRMRDFINIIKEELFDNCKQIIVFTHYENFFKLLVELTKYLNHNCSFIKIKHGKETNTFERIDDLKNEPILLDDFQKILNNAINFINEDCENYTGNEARVLMEKVLGYRFSKEIADKKILDIKNGLRDFLLDLKEKSYIDNNQFIKMNDILTELNNLSHGYDTYSLKSKRNCVKDLWESLHDI